MAPPSPVPTDELTARGLTDGPSRRPAARPSCRLGNNLLEATPGDDRDGRAPARDRTGSRPRSTRLRDDRRFLEGEGG